MSDAPLVIEVFPMASEGVIAENHDDVDHWDILVRPDGGDPIAEFKNLTWDEFDAKVAEMEIKYPFVEVSRDLE